MKLSDMVTFQKPNGKWFPDWQARIGTAVRAHGKTQAEATANLARKVQEGFEGDYTPILLQAGGYSVLVWRTPEGGWLYGRIQEDGRLSGGVTISGDTREGAERHARQFLAGYIVACAPADATNSLNLEAIAETCIPHEGDRANWLERERFARRARLIREQYDVTWEEALHLARDWQVTEAEA